MTMKSDKSIMPFQNPRTSKTAILTEIPLYLIISTTIKFQTLKETKI